MLMIQGNTSEAAGYAAHVHVRKKVDLGTCNRLAHIVEQLEIPYGLSAGDKGEVKDQVKLLSKQVWKTAQSYGMIPPFFFYLLRWALSLAIQSLVEHWIMSNGQWGKNGR